MPRSPNRHTSLHRAQIPKGHWHWCSRNCSVCRRWMSRPTCWRWVSTASPRCQRSRSARRRGVPLQARMIAEYGTVRELAAAVDTATAFEPAAERGGPIGVLRWRWLYEHGDPCRLSQTYVIRLPSGATAEKLRAMLDAIVSGHPLLRSRFDRETMSLIGDGPLVWPFTEVEDDTSFRCCRTPHRRGGRDARSRARSLAVGNLDPSTR